MDVDRITAIHGSIVSDTKDFWLLLSFKSNKSLYAITHEKTWYSRLYEITKSNFCLIKF